MVPEQFEPSMPMSAAHMTSIDFFNWTSRGVLVRLQQKAAAVKQRMIMSVCLVAKIFLTLLS